MKFLRAVWPPLFKAYIVYSVCLDIVVVSGIVYYLWIR